MYIYVWYAYNMVYHIICLNKTRQLDFREFTFVYSYFVIHFTHLNFI